ncbi:MAG: TetR/AcrR family transcriptional regulator [Alphaproteobacteria bacterium]
MSEVPRRGRLNHDEIIAAAIPSFHENGYAQTTLADVARRLGVTDKALYYYFGSKDALYLECLNRCANEVGAMIDSIARSERPGLEKIKSFARAMIRRPALQLHSSRLPGHLVNEEAAVRFSAARRAHEENVIGWIRDGIADRSILAEDPELLWDWSRGALVCFGAGSGRDPGRDPERLEKEALAMLDRSLGANRGGKRRPADRPVRR